MNIIQRVQDILLKPKETWPVIEQEATDIPPLYKSYAAILAAIPAIAAFIGLTVVGIGGYGVHVRMPLLAGLANMVVSYVLSLVMMYLLALVVEALAPSFGGIKNRLNAFKLIVYAGTAAMVGGIFSLLPALSILGLLAALYSLYLLYTGLPVLMKNPPEKSIAYTVVIVVCAIVAGIIMGVATSLLSPMRGMAIGSAAAPAAVSVDTPKGTVVIDTAQIEALAKKMEKAQASGDNAAAGKAATDMINSLTNPGVTPAMPAASDKR